MQIAPAKDTSHEPALLVAAPRGHRADLVRRHTISLRLLSVNSLYDSDRQTATIGSG